MLLYAPRFLFGAPEKEIGHEARRLRVSGFLAFLVGIFMQRIATVAWFCALLHQVRYLVGRPGLDRIGVC